VLLGEGGHLEVGLAGADEDEDAGVGEGGLVIVAVEDGDDQAFRLGDEGWVELPICYFYELEGPYCKHVVLASEVLHVLLDDVVHQFVELLPQVGYRVILRQFDE
jgi:hypothetical protein